MSTKRFLVTAVGLLAFGLIVAFSLDLATQWDRLSYLWFEIPQIETDIARMPGVSVDNVEDLGPPDEVYVWVTLDIAGKGKLIVISPSYESIANSEPVVIAAFGKCLIPAHAPQALKRMSLLEIINRYDELQSQAEEQGWCEFR
jgi:hypothetical protein